MALAEFQIQEIFLDKFSKTSLVITGSRRSLLYSSTAVSVVLLFRTISELQKIPLNHPIYMEYY